jgi:hypothetical protein
MNFKKWISAFLVTCITVCLIYALYNALVDPFGVFGDKLLDYGEYSMTENPRVAKIGYLKENHEKYDSYVIGCSKSSSLPTKALNRYFDASFYNMIMYGGDLYDIEKTAEYIINNYSKVKGEIIHLCFDVVCRNEYGKIIFEKKQNQQPYCYALPVGGEVYIKEAGIKFISKIIPATEMKKQRNTEFFDITVAQKEIKLRSRTDGDRIIPFGHKTPVKVKDVLIKNKMPKKRLSKTLHIWEISINL